jgi:hypothetical protein
VPAAGGEPVRVTTTADGAACAPSWSRVTGAVAGPRASPAPGSSIPPVVYERGPLAPGRYVADKFQPPFEFTVGEGWYGRRNYVDAVVIAPIDADPPVELDAGRIQVVLTGPCPDAPTQALGPAPRDLLAWLQSRKDIVVSQPQPVNMAGRTGIAVDVTVAEGATPCEADSPFFLFRTGQDIYWMRPGDKSRFVAVDVGGTTVTFTLTGYEEGFDEFVALSQPVLDSIVFR